MDNLTEPRPERDYTEEIHVDERDAELLAPETMQSEVVIGEPDKAQETPSKNRYTIIRGTGAAQLALEAMGDLLIVIEDKFKSGFECPVCNAGGEYNELASSTSVKTMIPCGDCASTGMSLLNPLIKCKSCQGSGSTVCPSCGGTGGTLITPETAQRRPTTGTVMSSGPETKFLFPGDRVLYSLFAGSAIQLKQRATVRIMHEHEVMCKLHGNLKVGDYIK